MRDSIIQIVLILNSHHLTLKIRRLLFEFAVYKRDITGCNKFYKHLSTTWSYFMQSCVNVMYRVCN
jgi:hypothetical protein